jgi:hypothetical protein
MLGSVHVGKPCIFGNLACWGLFQCSAVGVCGLAVVKFVGVVHGGSLRLCQSVLPAIEVRVSKARLGQEVTVAADV